jgi:hypothetical protein
VAHRSFSAARREATGEPLTFDIEGEQFTLRASLPMMPLLDLAAAAEQGNELDAALAFRTFLHRMVPDNDGVRLTDAIARADWGHEELLELVRWVVEETTGHPSQPPSDSPRQQPTSGRTLRRISSEQDTRPTASSA